MSITRNCNHNGYHNDPFVGTPLGMPSCIGGPSTLPVVNASIGGAPVGEGSTDHESLKSLAMRAFTMSTGASEEAREQSQEALEATHRAVSTGTPFSHSQAAESHELAARLHEVVGRYAEETSSHQQVADLHLQAAEGHRAAASAYPGHTADLESGGKPAGVHDEEFEDALGYAGDDDSGYDELRTNSAGSDDFLAPNLSLHDFLACNDSQSGFQSLTGVSSPDYADSPDAREADSRGSEAMWLASQGKHGEAYDSHHRARIAHERLADKARKDGKHRLAQHHQEAANRHKRAAAYHSGLMGEQENGVMDGGQQDMTGNEWSDAAREAARTAREAMAHAKGHGFEGGRRMPSYNKSVTKRALGASQKASKEGTATSHNEARDAHLSAASFHSSIPSKEHRDLADIHERAAAHHREASLGTIHNVSSPNAFMVPQPCLVDNSTPERGTRLVGDDALVANVLDDGYLPTPRMDFSRDAERVSW